MFNTSFQLWYWIEFTSHLSSGIPESTSYGGFVYQHIRYTLASSVYDDFIMRCHFLTLKLKEQCCTGIMLQLITSSNEL